jgi:hypothetical protein
MIFVDASSLFSGEKRTSSESNSEGAPMPKVMGGQDAERVQVQPAKSTTETPAQRAERERCAAADGRPCGGYTLGRGIGMMGSGN